MLAQLGYTVTAVDRVFSAEVEHAGVTMVELDLRDTDRCEHLVAQVDDPLTVLVNAAAVRPSAPVLDQGLEGWRHAFEVNVLGAFTMLRAAARRMPEGGSIVNVASAAAYGKRNLVAYGATKSALISLSRTAALELDAQGVRVNAVLPGTTATPMLTEAGENPARPRSRNIGGQVLTAEDVASAVVRVVRDPLISGAVIPVGLLPTEW